jgi:hypothetical protein
VWKDKTGWQVKPIRDGETEGGNDCKIKTMGYFSRRLIQNFWQLEGIVKENDSQCLAKNVIFQKNEYGM